MLSGDTITTRANVPTERLVAAGVVRPIIETSMVVT
jgi:hypothetical protein